VHGKEPVFFSCSIDADQIVYPCPNCRAILNDLLRRAPVRKCLLWVRSRHLQCTNAYPLYPQKWASASVIANGGEGFGSDNQGYRNQ